MSAGRYFCKQQFLGGQHCDDRPHTIQCAECIEMEPRVGELFSDVTLDDFIAERDAVLIDGDLDKMIAFHQIYYSRRPVPPRETVEVSLHKARTAVLSLPAEVRAASKAWLEERGYKSMDDGDVG